MSMEAAKPVQATPEAGAAKTETPVEAKAPETKEAPAPESSSPQAKTDQPAPESKEPEAQKEALPEKYELKLPEGSLLDAKAVEEIGTLAKSQGLSHQQAQAILERENAALATFVDGQKKQLSHMADVVWPEAAKTDKEIGGNTFTQSVELAHRVIKRFGTEKLTEELNQTGYGNHPELIRIFSRIGKAMSEDRMVIPGEQAGGSKRIEDIFYPNMKKE